ncbi:HupE/UreJ family protein [Candidatus Mycalebacterium sp.]
MRIFLLLATFFSLGTSNVFAHHPWEGAVLTHWYQGLLSGVAHPALGLDHLALLAAVAVFCAICFGSKKALLAFVPATIAGVFAHLFLSGNGFEIPFYETAVAVSVALAGVAIFTGAVSNSFAAVLCAVFGLFHGYAYGGGIVGSETSPLVFYLIGLAVVQTALVAAMAFLFPKLSHSFRIPRTGFSKAAGFVLFVTGAVISIASVPL